MGRYKVTFRDGRPPKYGEVSIVEANQRYFLFLEKGLSDALGMLGKDGEKIHFHECASVYMRDSQGQYRGEEQIALWRQSVGVWSE